MNVSLYKRNYHPLIILFYVYGMLDHEQLATIPKNTRKNWNKFQHEGYDCEEWVRPFLKNFEDIKTVFMREQLMRSMMTLVSISNGYHQVLSSITQKKKLLKEHADAIVASIDKLVAVSEIKIERACCFYGVSKDWYYREKQRLKCTLSPIQLCYKQQPNQLTYDEVSVIEKIISKTENHGKAKTTLYYQALKQGILFCGKSTFNKYASALGFKRKNYKKLPPKKGFRASRVFEWLHVDITYVPTLEEGMQKVAFVKDNFSKGLLHYKSTSGKAGSEFIASLFQETFEKYNLFDQLNPINILSDGGSENKGELLSWVNQIKAPPIVNKITARTEAFPYSNSMSESTHSIYKTGFMKKQLSKNETEHLENIAQFVTQYNEHRYPTELYGLTPLEVIHDNIPDKHLYREQIQQARKDRISVNQQFNDCPIHFVSK